MLERSQSAPIDISVGHSVGVVVPEDFHAKMHDIVKQVNRLKNLRVRSEASCLGSLLKSLDNPAPALETMIIVADGVQAEENTDFEASTIFPSPFLGGHAPRLRELTCMRSPPFFLSMLPRFPTLTVLQIIYRPSGGSHSATVPTTIPIINQLIEALHGYRRLCALFFKSPLQDFLKTVMQRSAQPAAHSPFLTSISWCCPWIVKTLQLSFPTSISQCQLVMLPCAARTRMSTPSWHSVMLSRLPAPSRPREYLLLHHLFRFRPPPSRVYSYMKTEMVYRPKQSPETHKMRMGRG
ncbi:hypothetical protein CC2G_009942 [Coprinopsis cinerea AmutBmut pab1-1]|nr:hypothetical protein CC2G_009942 [Coprinopsis cinerea AmutBmut pab1-1]